MTTQNFTDALDRALESPDVACLDHAERLALVVWWLIDRTSCEFRIPGKQAADEVAALCGLVKQMMGGHETH